MARIYLIGQHHEVDKNLSIYFELLYRFKELGHDIVQDESEFGVDQEHFFRRAINSADVMIPIITKQSLSIKSFTNEIVQIRNYTSHRDDKLFIPIVASGVENRDLPESILSFQYIRLENKYSEVELNLLVRKIDETINLFLGKKIANEEKAQEIKEKIETTAPTYISETIIELSNREKYQRFMAVIWYALGFLSLVGGIVVALWFSNNTLGVFDGRENWSLTLFYGLKSIFIIILLIASSKYSFNLAKSYMAESLKIADRIHAISFGKFYLQVFKDQINPSEIKEIFRDWNINNQTNNFSNQSAADYDPMILQKLVEVIDKIRNVQS